MAVATRTEVTVERLSVSAYSVPTDAPESDGTLEWDSTTIVVVEVHAGGESGLGYTYGPTAVATLIDGDLRSIVHGSNAIVPVYTAGHMCRALRNAGHLGIAMLAVSAVDIALWDLKARMLDVPLAATLPRFCSWRTAGRRGRRSHPRRVARCAPAWWPSALPASSPR